MVAGVCRYRPRVKFEQDGLSADGEQLLEALSSANMDTADARTPHSDSPGAAPNPPSLLWANHHIALLLRCISQFLGSCLRAGTPWLVPLVPDELVYGTYSMCAQNGVVRMEGGGCRIPADAHTSGAMCRSRQIRRGGLCSGLWGRGGAAGLQPTPPQSTRLISLAVSIQGTCARGHIA